MRHAFELLRPLADAAEEVVERCLTVAQRGGEASLDMFERGAGFGQRAELFARPVCECAAAFLERQGKLGRLLNSAAEIVRSASICSAT